MKPKHIIGGTCFLLALLIILASSGLVNTDVSPEPKPTTLSALIVEETEERTPEQAVLILSPETRKLFENGRFMVVDQDVPATGRLVDLIVRAKELGLPTVFFLNQENALVYEGPLPKSLSEFEALVKTVSGGT